MTRVDFYIIDDESQHKRLAFACKLIAKAFRLDHQIYIQCEDENLADQLDDLLWSAQTSSFIPHHKAHSDSDDQPIIIGWESPPDNHFDLYINLSQQIPPHFSRFSRLIEVINQEPDVLTNGRKNYQNYQQKNYPLYRHDLRKPTFA